MAFKQYKIDDMIKALKKQKKDHGNLLVELSRDEEGNGFHPVGDIVSVKDDKKTIMLPFGNNDGKLQIYPC